MVDKLLNDKLSIYRGKNNNSNLDLKQKNTKFDHIKYWNDTVVFNIPTRELVLSELLRTALDSSTRGPQWASHHFVDYVLLSSNIDKEKLSEEGLKKLSNHILGESKSICLDYIIPIK